MNFNSQEKFLQKRSNSSVSVFLNRTRGEISIVILVIGVFVICTLAILTFFASSSYVKDSFVGVGLMSKLNSQVENYFLDKNFPINSQIGLNGEDVFYQEKVGGRKFFFFGKDKLEFYAQYPLR